jgi:endonuclease YncB( thermonuclease family)
MSSVHRAPFGALVLATLALPLAAHSDTLQGHVVGVTDGDTITLLDATKAQYKIRVAGIDAPEKKQPFGQRSKESLSDLAFNKDLTIEWSKKDRYGRIVGKLINKQGRDLNLEQVKLGMAWHYKKYEKEQSPEDRRLYAAAEDVAKGKHVGLWSAPNPVPPWDYRKMKRNVLEGDNE